MPMSSWMTKFWEGGKSLAYRSADTPKTSPATAPLEAKAKARSSLTSLPEPLRQTAKAVGTSVNTSMASAQAKLMSGVNHVLDAEDSHGAADYMLNLGQRNCIGWWRDPAQSQRLTRPRPAPQPAGRPQREEGSDRQKKLKIQDKLLAGMRYRRDRRPACRPISNTKVQSPPTPIGLVASKLPSEGQARKCATPSHDVLLLSWDDVLFPTLATREAEEQFGDGARNLHTHRFARHGELVAQLLRRAVSSGASVFILCRSPRQWAERFAQTYLPMLNLHKLAQDLGIEIIYAEDMQPSTGMFEDPSKDALESNLFMTMTAHALYEAVRRRIPGGERLNISAVVSDPNHRRGFHAMIGAWSAQQLLWRTPRAKCIRLPETADVFSLSACLTELLSFVDSFARSERDCDFAINHPAELRGACLQCVREHAREPEQQDGHRWSFL